MLSYTSASSKALEKCWIQAIAKAEAVTGIAARVVRARTLCLCRAPGEVNLAARLLLVRQESAGGPYRDGCLATGPGVACRFDPGLLVGSPDMVVCGSEMERSASPGRAEILAVTMPLDFGRFTIAGNSTVRCGVTCTDGRSGRIRRGL
jgi:hypothetical protein